MIKGTRLLALAGMLAHVTLRACVQPQQQHLTPATGSNLLLHTLS
jgi:hypothetical protein